MRVSVIVIVALLGLLLMFPSSASAQECAALMSRPYVCQVELRLSADGGRWARATPDSPIRIPAGTTLDVEVIGIDQYGREFPSDRAGFELETSSSCRRLLRASENSEGLFSFTATTQRGRCQAWLWIPGNLNLEWSLELEVQGIAVAGYSKAQSEYIVRRLYLGVLGREIDAPSLPRAVSEIQRGRLSKFIESMVKSKEYKKNRRNLPSSELLEDFYLGLLGREPDSAGVRSYLKKIERGQHRSVIRDLVKSEEFERNMLAESGGVRLQSHGR